MRVHWSPGLEHGLASKGKPQAQEPQVEGIRAAELLAAIGYMSDMAPTGCLFHAWRVALVAERTAAAMCSQVQRDVFYAGLLHDIGAVGAYKHVTRYMSLREQKDEVQIKTHAQRGAALVNWLPGMATAALFVRSHHEWWDGTGYPDGLAGDLSPIGAQVIAIASTADTAGCFKSKASLRDGLPLLSVLTGRAWTSHIWEGFVRAVTEPEFCKALFDAERLPAMIAAKIGELPLPSELDCEGGVERILHLIAALVDLKDPSTQGHSLRAARRTEALMSYMKQTPEMAKLAYRAALVHDCGRLGVDTNILNKSGRLNEREMDIVRMHAEMTIQALSCLPDCPGLSALAQLAGHDHERYDGRGYPDGLAGDEIPFISRTLCVVDAFDSMIAAAHYRLLTPKGAVVRIEQAAGTQFDPEIARAVVETINSGQVEDFTQQAA